MTAMKVVLGSLGPKLTAVVSMDGQQKLTFTMQAGFPGKDGAGARLKVNGVALDASKSLNLTGDGLSASGSAGNGEVAIVYSGQFRGTWDMSSGAAGPAAPAADYQATHTGTTITPDPHLTSSGTMYIAGSQSLTIPLLTSGVAQASITKSPYTAGDNVFGYYLFLSDANLTLEQFEAAANGTPPPVGTRFISIAINHGGSQSATISAYNNGITGSANVTGFLTGNAYLRYDYATGDAVMVINGISYGPVNLPFTSDLKLTAAVLCTSPDVVFAAGHISVDFSDTTGGYAGFSSTTDASLPADALDNDWYEVSFGGHFHGKTTRAGQFVKLISGKTDLIVVDDPTVLVRSVNGVEPVSGDVTLVAADVGAIPSSEKGANSGVATLTSGGRLAQTVDGANVNQDSTHRLVTDTEKTYWNAKLDASAYNDRYKGTYTGLAALQAAHPTSNTGDYAIVDPGAGTAALEYIWDEQDGWVRGSDTAPTTTDALPEGSTNLYFTAARVRAAILTGLSTATNAVITATDSVLSAFGKLQKQVSDNLTTLSNHTSNTSNPHSVTKSQVGLGNVPNTDATDPSNIVQTSSYRFVSDTEKTTWNGKEPAISSGTTAQYWRGDKSWQALNAAAVSLGNVTNDAQFKKVGDTLAGTGGNGFFGAIKQSSKPSTPSNGFRLYADASSRLSWIGENGFVRVFDGTGNTADRTYTLPDTDAYFMRFKGSIAWTSLPAAASGNNGDVYFVTDVGVNGSYWQSNGSNWFSTAPITTFTSIDSYGRAPTGTINTGSSGNITFGTAANRAYTEGLYVYLPSIATTPAITAGFYWCVMSNTTTGTLYASKGGAAINFTVGASYTGVTSSVDLPAQTLKGGVLGSYRRLSISGILSVTNNANAKTTSIRFGGSAAGSATFQSAASWPFSANIQNKTASLQHVQPAISGTGAGSTSVTTVNTATDQTYNPYLSGGGSTATDWWIVDCWQAVLFPH